jgi:hypothetical protein
VLRLRSLDPTVAFAASIDDLLATTMEPLQDVDTALLAGVDRQFQVSIEGTLTDVSAIVDLPENPGERTPPYILITPLVSPGCREEGRQWGNHRQLHDHRRLRASRTPGDSARVPHRCLGFRIDVLNFGQTFYLSIVYEVVEGVDG